MKQKEINTRLNPVVEQMLKKKNFPCTVLYTKPLLPKGCIKQYKITFPTPSASHTHLRTALCKAPCAHGMRQAVNTHERTIGLPRSVLVLEQPKSDLLLALFCADPLGSAIVQVSD